jgi:DNA-directed RNA polymerase subunit M/transcription elongation factor TFIIS
MGMIGLKRLRTGDPCPQCRQGQVYRVKRRDWMRRLPRSKYYKCRKCKARFLAMYWFTIRLEKGG